MKLHGHVPRWKILVLLSCVAALPTVAAAAGDAQPAPTRDAFGGTLDVQPGSIDGNVRLDAGDFLLRARLVDPGVEGQLQVTVPGLLAGTAEAANGALSYRLQLCGAGVTFNVEGTRSSAFHLGFQEAAANPQACTAAPAPTAEAATIMGPLAAAQTQPATTESDGQALLMNWLRRFVGLSLLAGLLVLFIPAMPNAIAAATRATPWRRLGLGLALGVTLPLIAVLVFAIGLSIGLWWLGVLVLALYPTLLVLSLAVSGLAVGSLARRWISQGSVPMLLISAVGMALLTLFSLLPYIGPAVTIVAIIFGLGLLALAPRTPAPEQRAPVTGGEPLTEVVTPVVPDAPLAAA